MFKITGKSGYRSGSGGRKAGRVSSARMGRMTPFRPSSQGPAFSPDTLVERSFDSNSPRLGGLEAGH